MPGRGSFLSIIAVKDRPHARTSSASIFSITTSSSGLALPSVSKLYSSSLSRAVSAELVSLPVCQTDQPLSEEQPQHGKGEAAPSPSRGGGDAAKKAEVGGCLCQQGPEMVAVYAPHRFCVDKRTPPPHGLRPEHEARGLETLLLQFNATVLIGCPRTDVHADFRVKSKIAKIMGGRGGGTAPLPTNDSFQNNSICRRPEAPPQPL